MRNSYLKWFLIGITRLLLASKLAICLHRPGVSKDRTRNLTLPLEVMPRRDFKVGGVPHVIGASHQVLQWLDSVG